MLEGKNRSVLHAINLSNIEVHGNVNLSVLLKHVNLTDNYISVHLRDIQNTHNVSKLICVIASSDVPFLNYKYS